MAGNYFHSERLTELPHCLEPDIPTWVAVSSPIQSLHCEVSAKLTRERVSSHISFHNRCHVEPSWTEGSRIYDRRADSDFDHPLDVLSD